MNATTSNRCAKITGVAQALDVRDAGTALLQRFDRDWQAARERSRRCPAARSAARAIRAEPYRQPGARRRPAHGRRRDDPTRARATRCRASITQAADDRSAGRRRARRRADLRRALAGRRAPAATPGWRTRPAARAWWRSVPARLRPAPALAVTTLHRRLSDARLIPDRPMPATLRFRIAPASLAPRASARRAVSPCLRWLASCLCA